jgi:hypothetical protein
MVRLTIEKYEIGGACSMYGERESVYGVVVGKRAGKRQLGRPRRRWEDNIKIDLQKVGWGHGLDRAGSG